jgi:hypothetical protein
MIRDRNSIRMDLPDIVTSALDSEESVLARVPLGGDDALLVTSRRTLVYRAEGLLSEESIDEFPHDAERIAVSEGRRNAKLTLDYGLDGERSLKLPAKRLATVLEHVLAGVLDATGVTDADEEVTHVFRFSELTLVITTKRVVKHIGEPVWDEDFEQYHYEDVTDLTFEEGSVATSVVLRLGDRQERFKAPNEQARAVREGLESVLLAFHDVESLEELRIRREAESESDTEADGDTDENVDFGAGPDPLGASPPEPESVESPRETGGSAATAAAEPGTDGGGSAGTADNAGTESTTNEATSTVDQFADSGFEPASQNDADLAAEVAELREAIEQQNQQLREQRQIIETLIDELRRGR